jgi:hypothetical protein
VADRTPHDSIGNGFNDLAISNVDTSVDHRAADKPVRRAEPVITVQDNIARLKIRDDLPVLLLAAEWLPLLRHPISDAEDDSAPETESE